MARQDEIVAAARACVGARFRPHGRSIAHGLDCVGVAAHAFGRGAAADYPLRTARPARIADAVAAAGLTPIAPAAAEAGDLLLIAAGPGQLHLAVLTGRGFIHADVGLRRIVEAPGRPAGAVLAAWREGR